MNLRKLVYTALMTAIILIMTLIIKIPIPFTNGYVHAGDMGIFLAGLLLGPWYGAFAAGVGSALADLLGGYVHWVIPTFIIKSLMGMIVGYFAIKRPSQKWAGMLSFTVWTLSLIAMFINMTHLTPHFVLNTIEDAKTLTEASALLSSIKTQLMVSLFAIPGLLILFYALKKTLEISFRQSTGILLAGIWMVMGYYLASGIMYGSFIVPIFSLPWNIVQFVVGGILATVIMKSFSKVNINYARINHVPH